MAGAQVAIDDRHRGGRGLLGQPDGVHGDVADAVGAEVPLQQVYGQRVRLERQYLVEAPAEMQAVVADVGAHVHAAPPAPRQTCQHESVECLQFFALVAAEDADLVRDMVADDSGQLVVVGDSNRVTSQQALEPSRPRGTPGRNGHVIDDVVGVATVYDLTHRVLRRTGSAATSNPAAGFLPDADERVWAPSPRCAQSASSCGLNSDTSSCCFRAGTGS